MLGIIFVFLIQKLLYYEYKDFFALFFVHLGFLGDG